MRRGKNFIQGSRNHRKPEDRYRKVYNRVLKSVIRTTGTGRLRMTRQRESAVHMRIFRERESRRHKNSTCEGKARGFDRAAACQSARKGHSDIFSTDRTERARPPAHNRTSTRSRPPLSLRRNRAAQPGKNTQTEGCQRLPDSPLSISKSPFRTDPADRNDVQTAAAMKSPTAVVE